MGALCQVGGIVARAVVHRVVVSQSHLVARQQTTTVAVQCGQVHGAVPQAALQHAALEELLLAVGSIFGSTERQLSRAAIDDVVLAAHLLLAIEHQPLVLVVQNHGHALEASELQHRVAHCDDGVAAVVDDCLQPALLGEPQLQALALAAVREEGHVVAGVLGLDHHLQGDVLIGEVAARLGLCIAVAAELQRRSLLHGRLVGLAHHLEVGGSLQVVVLDVL